MYTFTLTAIKLLLFILYVLCACNSKWRGPRDIIAFCEHLRLPKDIEVNIWSDKPIDEVNPWTFYANTLSQFIPHHHLTHNSNTNKTHNFDFSQSQTNTRNVFIASLSNTSTLLTVLQQISELFESRKTRKSSRWWESSYFLLLSFPFSLSRDAGETNLSEFIAMFPLNSGIFMLFEDLFGKYQLIEMYSIKEKIFLEPISLEDYIPDFVEINQKVGRRRNFHNVVVVGVAPEFAHDVRIEEINGTSRFISGSSVLMYFYLRDELNFTEKALRGGWLFQQKTGTVAGESYRLVESGEADLSISQVTIFPYRAQALDFLQPTYLAAGIHAFFQQPQLSTLRDISISAFKPILWLTILIAWICIVIFFLILRRAQTWLYESREYDGIHVIIWAIGATCQKGWHKFPTSTSMRLVFFTGSLMSLVIYTAYSAAIVSVLSVPLFAIRSFPDLISHHFTFTVYDQDATLQYFLQNLIESFHLDQKVVGTSSENAINRIISSTYAFMAYPDNFFAKAYSYNYTEQFLCDSIVRLPITGIVPDKSGMFVRKGSPLRKTFNHKIIRLKESGLNFRFMRHYDMNTSPVCSQERHPIVTKAQLSCKDMITAYVIISLGFLLSFAIVITEKIYYGIIIPEEPTKSTLQLDSYTILN